MSEAILIELKRIVESAVRPVRASVARKQIMREELLAHVTDAYAAELAKRDDAQTALEQTKQRFGSPIAVTKQLQESVPARDTVSRILDDLWFRPDDPLGRRVARYLVWHALIVMTVLPLWYLWARSCAWLVQAVRWPAEEPRLLGGPVLLLDSFFFAFTSFLLLWMLARGGRTMAARFQAQQEWEGLHIVDESEILA